MRRVTERAGIVGLAAFLAVDVVLVALALGSTAASVNGAGSPLAGSGTSAATSANGPATTATSATSGHRAVSTTAPAAVVRVPAAPLTVGLVGIDQSAALRFTVGACSKGGSVVEVSHDGGATWSGRSAPFESVVRIRVRPNQSVFSVGADQASGCVPAMRQSPSLTGRWGSAVKATGVWFRDPRDPGSVGRPTGGTSRPCQGAVVIDLAISDSAAAVLCGSGSVLTSSTGAQWQTTGTVAGALALAVDAQAHPYAVTQGIASCPGLAVVMAASPATVVGCIPLDLKGVAPGSVALSLTPASGWLRVGQTVYHASSSLADWKKTA